MTTTKRKNPAKSVYEQAPDWLVYSLFIICILFLSACLFAILHINIIPYQRLLDAVAGAIGFKSDDGVMWIINLIPVVRDIVGAIANGFIYIGGFILFFLVQLGKMLPKIIYKIPNVLTGILESAGNVGFVNSKDSGVVRRAKKALATGYGWALGYEESISLAAFVLDFIVCLLAYPPITGTTNPLNALTSIFTVLYYGQWQRISWVNLILFVLTVYGVDFCLNQIWAFKDLMKAYKLGKEKNAR